MNRLMGTHVLTAHVDDPTLRAYAHETRDRPGSVTVLLINLGADPRRVAFEHGPLEVRAITADSLDARAVRMNGELLVAGADGSLPSLDAQIVPEDALDVAPHAIVLVTL